MPLTIRFGEGSGHLRAGPVLPQEEASLVAGVAVAVCAAVMGLRFHHATVTDDVTMGGRNIYDVIVGNTAVLVHIGKRIIVFIGFRIDSTLRRRGRAIRLSLPVDLRTASAAGGRMHGRRKVRTCE